MSNKNVPSGASAAVLQPSEPVPETAISVEGPNFDNSLDLQDLLGSYERIGFQATSFGRAVNIINKMVSPAHRFSRPCLLTSSSGHPSANGDSLTSP